MNSKAFLRGIFFLMITLVAPSCAFLLDGTVGKGSIIDEHVNVGSFTSVENTSSAEVQITKGDSLSVILSDYENLTDLWDLEVIDNRLIIKTKQFSSLVNSLAKVTIVMPDDLTSVAVSGSGKIELFSPFEHLTRAAVSGSGNIGSDVSTNFTTINLSISGSGSISLKGFAEHLKAVTTGSGKMYLSDLVAEDASCTISGSGNMYVNVVNTLKAVITGSGNIIYSGNPLIDVVDSGSGNVSHK